MTLDEFATVLADDRDATLVEFCFPDGGCCSDTTRALIDRLASEQREPFTIRRIDLSEHLQLAWEFGLSQCPTYIALRNGEEVFRATSPSSVDFIASGLQAWLGQEPGGELAIAAP